MNVGASAPEESGLYFSWGNSPGHAEGSGYNFSQEVYPETPGAAIEANLTLAEDMARQSLGAPWRMPTAAEFQELYDNCTSVWTTQNGVTGILFTSNVNGNSIFFPAAGYYDGTSLEVKEEEGCYWSSTYIDSRDADYMDIVEDGAYPQMSVGRSLGQSVRAVQ
jgi:hypothetical protein